MIESCFTINLKSSNFHLLGLSLLVAMEKNLFFIRRRVLFIFVTINIVFIKTSMSEFYTVGDEEGWNTDVNYLLWSENYNFSVGDVLVFSYSKNEHNVYEVTEDTFRSCNASSGVLATYFSGNDEISLNETKKYWFICNVADHCPVGMRFGIQVSSSNYTDSVLTPPSSPNFGPSFASQQWIVPIFYIILGIIIL